MRGIPSVDIDMHKKRPFSVHILRDVYKKRPFLVHIPLSSLCIEWGGECGESPVARRKRGDYGGDLEGGSGGVGVGEVAVVVLVLPLGEVIADPKANHILIRIDVRRSVMGHGTIGE